MAEIAVHADLDLESPTLVEGLPGIGLVGKIATDHLIEELGMTFYGSVRCKGLPRIGVYQEGERTVRPPVRLYADEAEDLVALQSEIPVDADAAPTFADCVTTWIEEADATPVYLSGYPAEERSTPPDVFGVATGEAGARLDDLEIDLPHEHGAVSGPTGALLSAAGEREVDAVGLVVESHPRFPDPEAARVLLDEGVEPLADVSVDLDALVDQADAIQEQRQQLAEKLQDATEEESSQAQPLRMFQ